jgi:PDZ domain
MKDRGIIMYKWIFFGCCALTQIASAQEPAAGALDAEQQVREELRVLLSRLAATGALGRNPEQIALSIDEPAQRVKDLGVLVDSTNADRARDGLRVLGTTPDGTAERLGIRAGDVLVSVNGTLLRGLGADGTGHALAARTLKSTVDSLPDDGTLQVQVQRAGSLVDLHTSMQSLKLPAFHFQLGANASKMPVLASVPAERAQGEGCGRLSMFDVAPRSEQMYRARILLIDGKTPGPQGQQSFRVNAGMHNLLIAEDIPTQEMGIGTLAQLRRSASKPLDVEVKPGTTLLIAAQLHRDRATSITDGAYWDPVVWKVQNERCP